mgnify:FL=1
MSTLGFGSGKHDDRWFEIDASNKGASYFDKYYGKESYAYKQEYMMTGGHVNTYNYFSKDTFRGYKNEYNNPRAFGGVQPPFSLGNGEIQLFDILIPATIAIIPFVL